MDDLKDILNLNSIHSFEQFKKGDILQLQGAVNTNSYFVKKGLLKSYALDEKGKKHIFMFAPENWVISDIESQQFDQLSELIIECIEDSEVLILNRESIQNKKLTIEQSEKMMILLFRRIAVLQRRIISMMSSSALERYQKFLEDYPDLPNRVPQWMIASYLGITPEALSKIRGQMARTK